MSPFAQIPELFIRHGTKGNGRAGNYTHIGITNRVFAAYVQLHMMRIGLVNSVCAAQDNGTPATGTFFRPDYFFMALFRQRYTPPF